MNSFRNSMNRLAPIWKYFKYLIPYWPFTLVLLAVEGLMAFLGLIQPLFPRVMFDYAYPMRNVGLFTAIILLGLAIFFIHFIINSLTSFLRGLLFNQIDQQISAKIYNHVNHLPYPKANRWEGGEMQVRINTDVGNVASDIASLIQQIVVQLFRFIFLLYATFSMNPLITSLALIGIPIYLLNTNYFGGKKQDILRDFRKANAEFIQNLQLKTDNVKTIQTFGTQLFELDIFNRYYWANAIQSMRNRLVDLISSFTGSLSQKLWGTLLSWLVGYQMITGKITFGEMMSITIYLNMLNTPITALADIYSDLFGTALSASRLDEILNESIDEETIVEEGAGITTGQITFSQIQFGYTPDQLILKGINLEVPPCSSLAIVGPSGSGKSTFINLLMRYYSALEGLITIDGKPISDYPLQTYRRSIGIVSQDVTLFPGTILDNLTYGMLEKPSTELVEQQCRRASFWEVIERLPKGLDTWVGSEGSDLSGGQRQRLAIARALIRQPRILIFDEATSALDSESEFRIQETIDTLMKEITVIMIAHRLSTIKKAHQIIVLEKGIIEEKGAFEELLAKKGAFFRFYNYQFGGYQAFMQKLDLELERGRRYEQSFSVMYARMTREKEFRAGHEGDTAMRYYEELGLFLQRTVRKIDYAVQVAGNEYAIVFPNTVQDNAMLGIVRIKEALAKNDLGIAQKNSKLEFGLITYPQTAAKTAEELVLAARAEWERQYEY